VSGSKSGWLNASPFGIGVTFAVILAFSLVAASAYFERAKHQQEGMKANLRFARW
jgi:hypothetical protein